MLKSHKLIQIAVVAFFTISNSLNAAEPIRGITALGTCIKKVAQDRASITVTTSILAANAGEASKRATAEHNKLRTEIQNLKLENMSVQTTNFVVGEEFDWSNNKQTSKGFRARISIAIESSDIARIGEVISVAAKHGVKELGQLQTFVSKEKFKIEYENCLETAAQNARDKATKLAKGAGVKLGRVLVIEEGSAKQESPVSPYSLGAMAKVSADSMEAAAPSIDTKASDLSVAVSVTFEAN